MIRNREEAAQAAERTHTNPVGACQLITRGYYTAPSAGDRDHDGDADAVDGWLSEPVEARMKISDNMPRGLPIRWAGGSRGFGHSAETLGDGTPNSTGDLIQSTDWPRSGITSTVRLRDLEAGWPKLRRLGISKTIDGILIPEPPKPAPLPDTRVSNFHEEGSPYDLKILDRAIAAGRSDLRASRQKMHQAVRRLPHDKDPHSRVKRFVDAYNNDRLLRMGVLHNAVADGRKGVVQDVYHDLQYLIHHLPKR